MTRFNKIERTYKTTQYERRLVAGFVYQLVKLDEIRTLRYEEIGRALLVWKVNGGCDDGQQSA